LQYAAAKAIYLIAEAVNLYDREKTMMGINEMKVAEALWREMGQKSADLFLESRQRSELQEMQAHCFRMAKAALGALAEDVKPQRDGKKKAASKVGSAGIAITRPGKLVATWHKRCRDIVFMTPVKADGVALWSAIGCDRTRPSVASFPGFEIERSLIADLDARGYDPKTLKFSISKKEFPAAGGDYGGCKHENRVGKS
jgi:hypothetical protein